MTGREEHSEKIKKRTLDSIADGPEILFKYYSSLRGKTENTKYVYIKYVEDFLAYFNGGVYSLKKSDIESYLDNKIDSQKRSGNKNGVSIINSRLAAIKSFYDFLVDDERISDNPTRKILKLKDSKPIEVVAMTPKEICRMKKNIEQGVGSNISRARMEKWKTRDLAIITLGCNTGLRRSAISEINVEDINFEDNTIRVTEKGNVGKYVMFGYRTAEVLKEWINDRENMEQVNSDALFITSKGQRITPAAIGDIVKRNSAGINKHITAHKMRSSCATNLYNKTHDIYIVQEVLGHKNIANTRRYAAVSEENKKRAADILDSL